MKAPDSAPAVQAAAVPVRVWDWPVRLFHWALVLLLISQVTTALIGGSAMDWHLRGGYAVLALVLFRIGWGLVGSHHARFRTFVRGPRAVTGYVRATIARRHEPVAGHTPAGGWMVLSLLVLLLAQAVAGLFANDEVATEGPLAKLVSDATSELLSSFHRRTAWVIVALAGVHVAAVLYYLLALRENLISAMVSGDKRLPPHLVRAERQAPVSRALAVLACCVLAVWWVVNRL